LDGENSRRRGTLLRHPTSPTRLSDICLHCIGEIGLAILLWHFHPGYPYGAESRRCNAPDSPCAAWIGPIVNQRVGRCGNPSCERDEARPLFGAAVGWSFAARALISRRLFLSEPDLSARYYLPANEDQQIGSPPSAYGTIRLRGVNFPTKRRGIFCDFVRIAILGRCPAAPCY